MKAAFIACGLVASVSAWAEVETIDSLRRGNEFAQQRIQQRINDGVFSDDSRARLNQAARSIEMDRQAAAERKGRLSAQSPADRMASYGFGEVKQGETGMRPSVSPGASSKKVQIVTPDGEIIEELYFLGVNIAPSHTGKFGTWYFGGGSDKSSQPILFESVFMPERGRLQSSYSGLQSGPLLDGNAMAAMARATAKQSQDRKTMYRGALPGSFAYAVSFRPTFCAVAGPGNYKVYTGYGFLSDEDLIALQSRLSLMTNDGGSIPQASGPVTSDLLAFLNSPKQRELVAKYGSNPQYTPQSEAGKKLASGGLYALQEMAAQRGDVGAMEKSAAALSARQRTAEKVSSFDFAEMYSYMNGAKNGLIWKLFDETCPDLSAGS